jgi:very-short-patch-repair endonuclease
VVVGGRPYPPSDAARRVAERKVQDGWIPGPVELGAVMPLAEDEVLALYRTNASLAPEDEKELAGTLPDPAELPAPDTFRGWIEEFEGLKGAVRDDRKGPWTRPPVEADMEPLGRLASSVATASVTLAGAAWVIEAVEAGRVGGPRLDLWTKLVTTIREVNHLADEADHALLTYDPELAGDPGLAEQVMLLGEIVDHLAAGKGLGFVGLLGKGRWKALLDSVRIQGGRPQNVEEFKALRALAQLELARTDLTRRWDRMVSARGGVMVDSLGSRPERALSALAPEIERYLGWHQSEWAPLLSRFASVGFDWGALVAGVPIEPGEYSELKRTREAADRLGPFIERRKNKIRLRILQDQVGRVHELLKESRQGATGNVVADLLHAVRRMDAAKYATAYERLQRVHALRERIRTRQSLLVRLQAVAPEWARKIENRSGPHGAEEPPGGPEPAWLWRQLFDTLEARAATDVTDLQGQLERVRDELVRTTGTLIERQAWAHQIRHVEANAGQRQALKGWAQTMRQIGAGTGKRAPRLRREARELMRACRGAVPVWVMPLSSVVESFDPHQTRFDVVVIDEASQLDVMGLIALFMAREVVVVGDHEQVSPAAVGQRIDDTDYLIREHLDGIPLAHLYDGKYSVYDLADSSFGRPIPLIEHFRCVPDIIAFSNDLSYDYAIKPLRDASQVSLRPHVVPHRVTGAQYEGKVNDVEALEVASLLVAATEHSAYEGATFGVVSMVGETQARLIAKLLQDHLPPSEYDRRRVLCGNPANFQGDERDVMFVSVVDAPREGPLPLRAENMYKQRFNVAASRARDQMWVVHSLNPETDLKHGDLRKRLIDHAYDPRPLVEKAMQGVSRTESEFEKRVLERLFAAGFRVVPQWEVGAYRIDLVVVDDDGRRLAVECDGDRFHPPDKLADDMARQAILERLGWQFVRLRGSVFFRDPDRAMRPVFERLRELGIRPAAGQTVPPAAEAVDRVVAEVVRRAQELRRDWAARSEPSRATPVAAAGRGSKVGDRPIRPKGPQAAVLSDGTGGRPEPPQRAGSAAGRGGADLFGIPAVPELVTLFTDTEPTPAPPFLIPSRLFA